MLDFLTKHFLILSSISIVIAAALSMTVLAAYLSVFDWNLIWLIEYSDITKLLLIGVAIISSFATTLIYQTHDVYLWMRKNSKYWKRVVLGGALLSVAIAGYIIYRDIQLDNHLETYHGFRAASLLLFLCLIYFLFREYDSFKNKDWASISLSVAFLTIFLSTVGATYAYYVRDVSTYSREISTKIETFSGAKIIMFLSHHVAFIAADRIIVLPTSEVTRIVSSATTTTKP